MYMFLREVHFLQTASILQPLDKNLIIKINEHVADGVSEVQDMQRHLKSFVKANFEEVKTDLNNRRFYPTDKAVADHMYLANQRMMHSKDDQQNLQKSIENWKQQNPNDNFLYRMKTEGKGGDSFLFVYQSEKHRYLLQRYGSIGLLDATYKTTKYALPLFFLCVKTNVDYQIVGTFICEHEGKESIKEGIATLKSWNPTWEPSYFMTDFDEKEINALEETFNSCKVYLCDFHREQAWTRWVNKGEHKVAHVKGEVLARLRRIAKASSFDDYKEALSALYASTVWKSFKTLQTWFSTYWLPHKEVNKKISMINLIFPTRSI